MALKIHETRLTTVPWGEYPVDLREAESLLVEERRDIVPMYMSEEVLNFLKTRTEQARKYGKKEGEVAAQQAREIIERFKVSTQVMLAKMVEEGYHPYTQSYTNGVLLSNDLCSSDPAVTQPEDRNFSFRFKPKTFRLGLTGRLLEDESSERFQEALCLECNIYDAYNLAAGIGPARIVAIGRNGSEKVVYENNKPIGKTEKPRDNKKRSHYVLHHETAWLAEQEVLPTGGLRVVYNDFWEKVKEKWDLGRILFGHKYASGREFLSMVTLFDEHLIWDIAMNQHNDPNKCLIDWNQKQEPCFTKNFPEHSNRLQLIPNNASLDLGWAIIRFDKPSGYQALMSLREVLRDIWVEPRDREGGWDVIYDQSRNITPENHIELPEDKDLFRQYNVIER